MAGGEGGLPRDVHESHLRHQRRQRRRQAFLTVEERLPDRRFPVPHHRGAPVPPSVSRCSPWSRARRITLRRSSPLPETPERSDSLTSRSSERVEARGSLASGSRSTDQVGAGLSSSLSAGGRARGQGSSPPRTACASSRPTFLTVRTVKDVSRVGLLSVKNASRELPQGRSRVKDVSPGPASSPSSVRRPSRRLPKGLSTMRRSNRDFRQARSSARWLSLALEHGQRAPSARRTRAAVIVGAAPLRHRP